MTTQEFKRVARILKEVYAELEHEALEEGIDTFSEEYQALVSLARERTLALLGFTLEEYRAAKELVAPAKKVDVAQQVLEASTIAQETRNSLEALTIPNEEEILAKVKEIAEAVVKAPVIQNNIVERTTVEKPTIVKETIVQTINEEFDASPLYAEIGYLNDKVDSLEIPEPFDPKELIDSIRSEFNERLKENINILGMPDFRKLAMGLQAQIDELRSNGGGASAFTDLTDAPSSYVGQGGKVVAVKGAENGVEFIPVGGTGTVTQVSVVPANGVSGSVATDTTTPAITLSLGAITPSSVTTSGDVEVTSDLTGIILKSADGTRWRIGITNAGQLTATSL